MEDERKRIGLMIAAMREKRGLTIEQTAEIAGITAGNLHRIEHGRYNVGIDILARIASALDVEITLVEK